MSQSTPTRYPAILMPYRTEVLPTEFLHCRVMLMTLQRWVFPSPDSAPTVISSTLIKASLYPIMIIYPTAVAIAVGSWKKTPEICSGKQTNNKVMNSPHTTYCYKDAR